MSSSSYVPMSWNGEPITTDKLNQMCNNAQYLFDRSPRVRYSGSGITRDTGVKMIAGKTPYGPRTTARDVRIPIYFGSFFTSGCHPSVTVSVEPGGSRYGQKHVYPISFAGPGVEIDQTGFVAVVWTVEINYIEAGGWVHWQAVGY